MSPRHKWEENTIFVIFIITCCRKEMCHCGISTTTLKMFMSVVLCRKLQKITKNALKFQEHKIYRCFTGYKFGFQVIRAELGC